MKKQNTSYIENAINSAHKKNASINADVFKWLKSMEKRVA